MRRDRSIWGAADPGGDAAGWGRWLDSPWQLDAGVDDQGALWLGIGGSPSAVIRCAVAGCDEPPFLDVGGPVRGQYRFLAAHAGSVFMRTRQHYVSEAGEIPPRARPKGPRGMFHAQTEGMLRFRDGRFDEVSLPSADCVDVDHVLPTAGGTWVFATDRCANPWSLVVMRLDAEGGVVARHVLAQDHHRGRGPVRWAAEADDLVLAHDGQLWRTGSDPQTLEALTIEGVDPAEVTAVAMSPGGALAVHPGGAASDPRRRGPRPAPAHPTGGSERGRTADPDPATAPVRRDPGGAAQGRGLGAVADRDALEIGCGDPTHRRLR